MYERELSDVVEKTHAHHTGSIGSRNTISHTLQIHHKIHIHNINFANTMSPNYSNLEFARTLNNKSCCLIKQGHYDEAVANLMAALKETKKTAIESDSNERDSAKASSQSKVDESCTAASPYSEDDHHNEFESLCKTSEAQHSRLAHSRSYVYQKPVFIHERKGKNEWSISLFSFYIMFNLALAHHLKALEGSEEERLQSLPVSKRLYELTFQMQAQEAQSNLVLMAALLNNLSLVHKALNNHKETEQCQQLLLSALLLVVDMRSDQVAAATGMQSDMEGFMGNVVHLIITESPVASAA